MALEPMVLERSNQPTKFIALAWSLNFALHDSAYTERIVGQVEEKLVVMLIKHSEPGNWSNAAKYRGHSDALSAD